MTTVTEIAGRFSPTIKDILQRELEAISFLSKEIASSLQSQETVYGESAEITSSASLEQMAWTTVSETWSLLTQLQQMRHFLQQLRSALCRVPKSTAKKSAMAKLEK